MRTIKLSNHINAAMLGLAGIAFAAFVVSAFVFGNAGDGAGAARRAALEEGFTQVDSVDRARLTFACRKRERAYTVTGVRDQEPAETTVCVSTFHVRVK